MQTENSSTSHLLFQKLFQSFIVGINSPKANKPREFLKKIGLDHQQLLLGFNSGQFHHRKDDTIKKQYLDAGILRDSNAPVKYQHLVPYTSFGNYGIIFPLKNKKGNIVNLFAQRFNLKVPKGEYLNTYGLYPLYPKAKTSRLFLCHNPIDAASLMQSGVLENRDAVLALQFGNITQDISDAIGSLTALECIVILFKTEGTRLTEELLSLHTAKTIVVAPENKPSLNNLWINSGIEGMLNLMDRVEKMSKSHDGFSALSYKDFSFEGQKVQYQIKGAVSNNPTLFEFEFYIKNKENQHLITRKINFLNQADTRDFVLLLAHQQGLDADQLLGEMAVIKMNLEALRTKERNPDASYAGFQVKLDIQAKQLLRSEDLFQRLDQIIENAGICGQQESRLILFLIAASYKFKYNSHAVIVTHESQMGEEYIQKIAQLFPENEQYHIDEVSRKSFRYYGNNALQQKLVVIPNYSGIMKSQAMSDLKKLQSNGVLTQELPQKGNDGFLKTVKQSIETHFSSIGAAPSEKNLFQIEPKTILIGMDHSNAQKKRLMEYEGKLRTGTLDYKLEDQSVKILRRVLANLVPYEVINPYAGTIMMPEKLSNALILTRQLNDLIALITLFKQHQRALDRHGRLIVCEEDVRLGIKMFTQNLMLNPDEPDGVLLDFFEKLKKLSFTKNKNIEQTFSSYDVQKAYNMGKSQINRLLKTLVSQEFLIKTGKKNTAYQYSIAYWDDPFALKSKITKHLIDALETFSMVHLKAYGTRDTRW